MVSFCRGECKNSHWHPLRRKPPALKTYTAPEIIPIHFESSGAQGKAGICVRTDSTLVGACERVTASWVLFVHSCYGSHSWDHGDAAQRDATLFDRRSSLIVLTFRSRASHRLLTAYPNAALGLRGPTEPATPQLSHNNSWPPEMLPPPSPRQRSTGQARDPPRCPKAHPSTGECSSGN